MSKARDKILGTIESLETISDEERAALLRALKGIDKDYAKFNFKLERLQKDKAIAEEILNATIKDLEKNKQKLEQSYKELEQFSYIASHDLKSPLRTIGNFAQLLKRRYYQKLDEDANEFIDYIVSGVAQMNDVILHSLEFAKVGREEVEFIPTDLNKIIGMVLLHIQDDIKKNQAQVIFENLPIVDGDKISLMQLFQNLISNAIKFKKTNEYPIIKITSQSLKNCWEIRVKDNGIGIEEAYRDKIFQPFKRIDDRNLPGSGIGLAICKKIVYLHRGNITFESEVGKGTTFILTLKKEVL